MTEERIIIILENDEQYEKFAGVIKLNGAYYYDPAPPKDWIPFCFSEACERGESLGVMSMDKEPCKSCPYRKME